MKNKFLITTILSVYMATTGVCAFAAETLDVPQDTSADTSVETVEQTTPLEDKTSETTQKPTKTKHFFTKAEKTKKVEKKTDETAQEEITDAIVDSETLEYYPERHEFEAIGNAKVAFPQEKSVLNADKIVFNHDTNIVKGFGHVVLVKEGQKVFGEYIQVDLNDENALLTHPVMNHMSIKIKAKTGNIYDAKTEAMDGKVTFNDKTMYKFNSRPLFNFDDPMLKDSIPQYFYFKEKYDNKWHLKAKTIIIDSYKDRDIATLKDADFYLQNTKIASAGDIKLYTDKEQQYIETNLIEVGGIRNIGTFISPGYVFKTPNSSTLKLGPALTYDSKIGVGAMGRFLTDKNRTDFGYSTSRSKIVVRGEQEFNDDLRLQYGINSYLDDGFLGGRLPQHGLQLIHDKTHEIEDLGISFRNRFSGGYAKDWERSFGTIKMSWQTMSSKSLFEYVNPEGEFAFDFGVNAQTHAALYGTGDTMGIVRVGPYIKTQYKAWQQYISFFEGGQAGDSPFNYDKNFYGKSNVVLGESLRICKYLTLMYSATVVLSGDTPNGTMLQENRFYAAIGPDDVKFLIGYDAYRQNTSMGLAMNIGAENSDVQFKRLVLNDPQALGKSDKKDKEKAAAQKKKEEEARKKRLEDTSNRSVKDYDDYNPGFNMMPGAVLQPSLIRPPGM